MLHWHQRQTYPEQTYCNTGGLFLCFILCHSMKTQSCFQKAEQTSKLPLEFALTLNSLHKAFKLQKIRTGRGCERNNSMKIHNDLQQRQRPLEEQNEVCAVHVAGTKTMLEDTIFHYWFFFFGSYSCDFTSFIFLSVSDNLTGLV